MAGTEGQVLPSMFKIIANISFRKRKETKMRQENKDAESSLIR
jgi:hypothetical protein